MKLRADWSEFIALLKRHGVRFLIVGAHALAVHGRPRYTDDFDVFVDATPANARRLQAALGDFGFVEAASAWERMSEPYQIMTLGRVEKIDILTSIAGVSFRTAWRNRKRVRDPSLAGPRRRDHFGRQGRRVRVTGAKLIDVSPATLFTYSGPQCDMISSLPSGRTHSASE